jgi:hypothetical protein
MTWVVAIAGWLVLAGAFLVSRELLREIRFKQWGWLDWVRFALLAPILAGLSFVALLGLSWGLVSFALAFFITGARLSEIDWSATGSMLVAVIAVPAVVLAFAGTAVGERILARMFPALFPPPGGTESEAPSQPELVA